LGVVTLNEAGEFTPQGTPEPERHLGDSLNLGAVGGIFNKNKNSNKDDEETEQRIHRRLVALRRRWFDFTLALHYEHSIQLGFLQVENLLHIFGSRRTRKGASRVI